MNRRSFLRLFGLGAAAGSVAVATQETDCRAFFRAYRQWWGRNRHLLMRQVMRPYRTSRALVPKTPLPPAVCDGLRKAIEQCAALTGRRPDALTMDTKEWVRAGRPTEYLGLRIFPRVDCPPDTIYVSNGELT